MLNYLQGGVQRCQFAAQGGVAFLAGVQSFVEQCVVHDATIIVATRRKSRGTERPRTKNLAYETKTVLGCARWGVLGIPACHHKRAHPSRTHGRSACVRMFTKKYCVACQTKPSVLSGRRVIPFAAFGRGEIHAADHHRQRHGVHLDDQGRGVSATRQLKAAAFETFCPNH